MKFYCIRVREEYVAKNCRNADEIWVGPSDVSGYSDYVEIADRATFSPESDALKEADLVVEEVVECDFIG